MVRTHTYWLSIDEYIVKSNVTTSQLPVKIGSTTLTRTKIYFQDG